MIKMSKTRKQYDPDGEWGDYWEGIGEYVEGLDLDPNYVSELDRPIDTDEDDEEDEDIES